MLKWKTLVLSVILALTLTALAEPVTVTSQDEMIEAFYAGATEIAISGEVVLTKSMPIPEGMTLIVPEGSTLFLDAQVEGADSPYLTLNVQPGGTLQIDGAVRTRHNFMTGFTLTNICVEGGKVILGDTAVSGEDGAIFNYFDGEVVLPSSDEIPYGIVIFRMFDGEATVDDVVDLLDLPYINEVDVYCPFTIHAGETLIIHDGEGLYLAGNADGVLNLEPGANFIVERGGWVNFSAEGE